MSKTELLKELLAIDSSEDRRSRVLGMSAEFDKRIGAHLAALPTASASFDKFNTSPFVLLFYANQMRFSMVSEIEGAIVPAKVFSSMETSAGRMIEDVVLPYCDWSVVPSQMHTPESALDGRANHVVDGFGRVATLKSGPRCLNDEMAENFADAIVAHAGSWAATLGVQALDFTYGVLYGTEKKSNKKDWHILRNLAEKRPENLLASPNGSWFCETEIDGIRVSASVRIGVDWWDYLGGSGFTVDLLVALIRACVQAGQLESAEHEYVMSDLADIVAPPDSNVEPCSILQPSQLPWLFFMARHFCDGLVD